MTDRYTKAMLTVIAGCLLFLCAKPYFGVRTVLAQEAAKAQEVKIVGISSGVEIPVNLAEVQQGALVPVRIDGTGANFVVPVGIAGGRGPIPVSIQGANAEIMIPVGIKRIGYNNTAGWGWYPIGVKQAP
jgi:hypothetical protein